MLATLLIGLKMSRTRPDLWTVLHGPPGMWIASPSPADHDDWVEERLRVAHRRRCGSDAPTTRRPRHHSGQEPLFMQTDWGKNDWQGTPGRRIRTTRRRCRRLLPRVRAVQIRRAGPCTTHQVPTRRSPIHDG